MALGWMAITQVRAGSIRANNHLDANQMSEQEWNRLTACIEHVRANSSDVLSSATWPCRTAAVTVRSKRRSYSPFW
ncbi:MAG: hypothetical protein AB7O65_11730 [Candidatus Korobacteraceae bacterium]